MFSCLLIYLFCYCKNLGQLYSQMLALLRFCQNVFLSQLNEYYCDKATVHTPARLSGILWIEAFPHWRTWFSASVQFKLSCGCVSWVLISTSIKRFL